jgi:hypothetical protein
MMRVLAGREVDDGDADVRLVEVFDECPQCKRAGHVDATQPIHVDDGIVDISQLTQQVRQLVLQQVRRAEVEDALRAQVQCAVLQPPREP